MHYLKMQLVSSRFSLSSYSRSEVITIYSFNTKIYSTLSEAGHLLRHKTQMDVV